MSMIEKRLKEVLGQEILVIQIDGKAFKGKLVEFDNEFMMLHDCLETSTKEIRWRTIIVPMPSTGKKAVRAEEGGMSIHNVLRIWLWDPEEYVPKELDDIGVVSL
jgi:small nuclear ribonucleoprotein (snRNP)-like protein